MADKDLHYYEPASGHGLKHDPFNAIVAPRPIVRAGRRGDYFEIKPDAMFEMIRPD